MASGSPEQERATDRQCDHCRRWFDARGIDAHEANCDGAPATGRDEADDANGDDPVGGEGADGDEPEPVLFDPIAEQEPEASETPKKPMSETPNCPNCSTDAQVTTTDELQEKLAERGRLTPENLQKTRQNTHYCHRCTEVFTDG